MAERLRVSDAVRALAQREADALVNELEGVTAAVVATADGFDVAACVRGSAEPARIAALASSIAAIGQAVSAESGLGESRCVTINTTAGFAVVHAATRADIALVVQIIASERALVGAVTYRAAEAARRLIAA